MDQSQKQKVSEEEIEVSSLIGLIIRFYKHITSSIQGVFSKVFSFIIYLLVHFKKHFIVISVITSLFAGFSIVKILKSEKSYRSSMTVKPHYSSTKLLYNNIEYYNLLIEQEDTTLLAKLLNCSPKITSKLTGIEIEPSITKSNKIDIFNHYFQKIDTNILKSNDVSFFDIVDEFDEYDYDIHKISVSANGNFDFTVMENILLNGISKNDFFIDQQSKQREKHQEHKRSILTSIERLDTLSTIFSKVLVENSQKPIIASPNPLFEKERKSDMKDIKWVFDEYTDLNENLAYVNIELSSIKRPITVVNSFNPRGIKEPRMIKVILAALLGFAVAVVFLLLRAIYNYIKKIEVDYL